MTTNDRCTVRGQQLTVSAYIHRVLTRAGISLVAAATFASAHAADGDKKPILVAASRFHDVVVWRVVGWLMHLFSYRASRVFLVLVVLVLHRRKGAVAIAA